MQNIEKTIMQRGIAILLPTKMKRRLDPLFGDVNQRKDGKRNNLSQTCKHKLAETVVNLT